MFYEPDRLLREDILQEAHMPTEVLKCTRCHKGTRITVDADKLIVVKCKHCGHVMHVTIESKAA